MQLRSANSQDAAAGEDQQPNSGNNRVLPIEAGENETFESRQQAQNEAFRAELSTLQNATAAIQVSLDELVNVVKHNNSQALPAQDEASALVGMRNVQNRDGDDSEILNRQAGNARDSAVDWAHQGSESEANPNVHFARTNVDNSMKVLSADDTQEARKRALTEIRKNATEASKSIGEFQYLLMSAVWRPVAQASMKVQLEHVLDANMDLRDAIPSFVVNVSLSDELNTLAAAARRKQANRLALHDLYPIFDMWCQVVISVPFSMPSLVGVPSGGKAAATALTLLKVHSVGGTQLLLNPPVATLFVYHLMLNGIIKNRPTANLLSRAAVLEELKRVSDELTISVQRGVIQQAAQPRRNNNGNYYRGKRNNAKGNARVKKNTSTTTVNGVELGDDSLDNNKDDSSFYTASLASSAQSSFTPPLAITHGVVNGVLANSLIDMGSQCHLVTAAFAARLGMAITATNKRPLAANGSSLRIVGEINDLVWSSHSSAKQLRKATRLRLSPALVIDGALPQQVDVLIGAGALYGKNPRRIAYANDAQIGFFVQFDDCSPLPLLSKSRQNISSLKPLVRANRAQKQRGTIDVLDSTKAQSLPPRSTKPAVTRDEQPQPTFSAMEVSVADDVRPLLQKEFFQAKNAPFVGDDVTPPVIPGLHCSLALKPDTDFNALAQPVPRQSQRERAAMIREAKRLLAANAAQHARSSPVLSVAHAVQKKDEHGKHVDDYRIVGAYHYVNNALIPDKYPLPRIDELLPKMAKAARFSKLDLSKAFEQAAFTDASLPLTTTYYAPGYVLERKSCAFGIANVPAAIQRFVEQLFVDEDNVVVYIDDLIILHFSAEACDVARDVRKVLRKLRSTGVSIKASKSRIGDHAITALGFRIGGGFYTPDEHRVEAWAKLSPPKTLKALRGFVHTLSHYSNHFPGLAKYMAPLRVMIKENVQRVKWNDERTAAFAQCKAYVLDHGVRGGRASLAPLPPPGTEVEIHTDWARRSTNSEGGVGWVIHSLVDSKMIACGSRSMPNGAIYNRPTRGELYALQCALRRDAHLLRDYDVTWVTDCKPAAEAWQRGHSESDLIRTMLLDLQAHWPRLRVKWVPREQNPIADMFSMRSDANVTVATIQEIVAHDAKHHRYLVRTPHSTNLQWKSAKTVSSKAPQLLQEFRLAKKRVNSKIVSLPIPANAADTAGPIVTRGRKRAPPKASLAREERAKDANYEKILNEINAESQPQFRVAAPSLAADAYAEQIIHAQREEPSFKYLWRAARGEQQTDIDVAQAASIKALQPQVASNGMLCVRPLTTADPPRVALPPAARPPLLLASHDNHGHYTGKASLAMLERHFWWPRIQQHVHEVAMSCKTCQEARQHRRAAHLGAPRLAGVAMQTLLVDMQTNIYGYDLLTILDVATRWQWIVPISRKTQTKKKSAFLARAFLKAVRPFGKPAVVVVDGGPEFKGDFREIITGATGARFEENAPYNPNARGAIERVHRTNRSIIAKLVATGDSIDNALFAKVQRLYNEAARSDCGISPFEAMFGRVPPPTSTASSILSNEAIYEAQEALAAIANVASNTQRTVAALQAQIIKNNNYRHAKKNEKAPKVPQFKVGDKVLYESSPAGSTKISNRIVRTGPFEITAISSNGHSLQLSYKNVVVETKVAARNCVRWHDVEATSFIQNSPQVEEWIWPPFTDAHSSWFDNNALAFLPRHYFASAKVKQD